MNLDKLLCPKSVAIIGASNKPGKVGYALVKNLCEAGFDGKIYPVNLEDKKVQGLKAYASVLKVKGAIDVAIVSIPAPFVPKAVEECAKKNIKNAIIISAGFSEVGEAGKKIEDAVRKTVEKNAMCVVGPNTLGVINTENGFNGSFSANFPKQGPVALVSQSGALCTAILDWARQEKIGFSKFISTGNKSFLEESQYFSYLERDAKTKAVFVYMESVKNYDAFMKAAARLARKKPVVLLKAGRSEAGQKAASSHTGAISGDDQVFSVMCRKANIIRINSIEGFFDLAKMFSRLAKLKKFRLGVLTNAGGPGVITADSASKHKFLLPEFSKRTLEVVKQINPNPHNPLDLIGDAKPIDYRTALKVLQQDKNIDIIYTLLTPQSMTNPERVADIVSELNRNKPIMCSFLGGTAVSHPKQYLKQHGIVEFDTPERGIKALSRFAAYEENRKKQKIFSLKLKGKAETKKFLAEKKELTIQEAYKLLREFGIKFPKSAFFSSKKEFEKQKPKISYPVVLKSDIASITHSTDFGLVKLKIKNKEELLEEIVAMEKKMRKLKKAPRFAVQEMVRGGEEVMISSMTKEFGKVITYGLGGIFVEVMKDISQKIAPLTDDDIEEMLSEVKGTQALRGARTKKKYDIESLKKTIKSLSLLAQTYPGIKEIEINPLIVTEKGCYAVDVMASI